MLEATSEGDRVGIEVGRVVGCRLGLGEGANEGNYTEEKKRNAQDFILS
jgi:hypothetical protein